MSFLMSLPYSSDRCDVVKVKVKVNPHARACECNK